MPFRASTLLYFGRHGTTGAAGSESAEYRGCPTDPVQLHDLGCASRVVTPNATIQTIQKSKAITLILFLAPKVGTGAVSSRRWEQYCRIFIRHVLAIAIGLPENNGYAVHFVKHLPKLQRCPCAGNFEISFCRIGTSANREWAFARAHYSELGVRRTDKTMGHCFLSHVADLADEELPIVRDSRRLPIIRGRESSLWYRGSP